MNLEELQKRIENMPWWENAYYATYRFFNSVKDFPREVKWFIQRGRRGYADCDIWSLHSYLSSFLPEALRSLAKDNVGCPADLFDNGAPKGKECHKWEAILEEIALGFESARKIDNMDYFESAPLPISIPPRKTGKYTDDEMKIVNAERERLEKLYERGMELFAKHYFGLWD